MKALRWETRLEGWYGQRESEAGQVTWPSLTTTGIDLFFMFLVPPFPFAALYQPYLAEESLAPFQQSHSPHYIVMK